MATQLPDQNSIQEFDFSVNTLKALLWQYNDAQNLIGLLTAKNAWYLENQTQFWENWITDVFDLRTANQFGLVVWSIILGFPLYVNTAPASGSFFGFDGAAGTVGFDQGVFGDTTGSSIMLPLTTQRIALQLRYTQLTCSGCVPEINRALKWIFAAYGKCYLLDLGNMTQEYVFNFPVSWDLAYLFNNFDILPRPACVQSSWKDATLVYFGFDGAGNSVNFDNAPFGA